MCDTIAIRIMRLENKPLDRFGAFILPFEKEKNNTLSLLLAEKFEGNQGKGKIRTKSSKFGGQCFGDRTRENY